MGRRFRSMRHRALWISAQNLLHIITILFVLAIFLSEGTRRDRSIVRKQRARFPISTSPVGITQRNSKVHRKFMNRGGKLSSSDASNEVVVHGNSLNLEEFMRQMQEKALMDALKRRAVIESQKVKWNNQPMLPSKASTTRKLYKGKLVMQDDGNHTGKALSEHFQGVLKTPENAHLFKEDNITHLSFMIYRLVKTHKISSLVDIPCKWSMFWMPELVQRLEYEVPGFRYSCIVAEDKDKVEALYRFRGLDSIEIISDPTYWASQVPQMDLALTWHSVGFLSPKKSWQLLKALRESGTNYVIVPNYPGLTQNPGVATKHGRINVRRAPYRFDEALRVIQNVSMDQAVRKQILFYDLDGIRRGVI